MKKKIITISVFLLGIISRAALAEPVYPPPSGGWTYIYTGDAAVAGPTDNFDSLDGTWDHHNVGDQWDGTGIGMGRPGGASALTDTGTTFLRLQDTGDPTFYGFGDPGSNRKITFGHSITNDIGTAGDAILDDGVTISFRARLSVGPPLDDMHPDGGGGVTPWPAGGDGYVTHDNGMGNFSIGQLNGGKIISFALALESDDDEVPVDGLVMNKLNGTSPTGDVDLQGNEPGTVNILPMADLTDWHEFWITIEPDASATGTHLVKVYTDGSLISTDFLVTAGDGNLYNDSYIALGVGSTTQSGAIDIDCFSYAEASMAPTINQPPVADAGPDQTVEQESYDGTEVTLDGSGSIDDGLIQPLTYTWTWDGGSATGASPSTIFPLGTTTVTLEVDDGEFTDTETVDITVEDTTDPVVTIISVNPEELWSPNHRMVPVIILIEAEDICTETDQLEVVVTVTSNEPDDDKGDGAFTGDVDGEDGFIAPVPVICVFDEEAGCFVCSFELRAERAGVGDGRVYTIEAECKDASQNTATDTAEVTVAHDQGKGKK